MKYRLVQVLRGIQRCPDTTKGICANFDDALYKYTRGRRSFQEVLAVREAFLRTMREAVLDWEYFSGIHMFPISFPNVIGIARTAEAFSIASKKNQLWVGEYGRRRKELLSRMIDIATVSHKYYGEGNL